MKCLGCQFQYENRRGFYKIKSSPANGDPGEMAVRKMKIIIEKKDWYSFPQCDK